jgi:hypothetical protein
VLKQLKQPPNLIQRLFDCVLILLRIPVQPSAAVEVKGFTPLIALIALIAFHESLSALR